jgi:PhnB protein
MPINHLNPYINFNGTAASAIALYEQVLGAQRVNIARAGDVPGTNVPADQRARILHGVLTVGGTPLMVSDATAPISAGANIHVSLNFTDPSEMTQRFAALSEGGAVTVAPQDTFWGAKFGMLIDRFGVRWMFNCEAVRP